MTDQSIADPIQIIKKNLLISNPSSFHSAYEAEVSIDSINDASFHSFNSVHTSNGTSSQLSFATPKSRTFSPINKKQNTSPQSNASPSDLNDRIERTHTSPIVNQIAIQSDSKEEYHNSAHNRHIGSYHSQLQSKRKSINVQSESISIPKTRSTHKDLLTKDNDSFPRTTTNSSLHSSQDDRAMSESLSKTQRLSLVAKNLNHEISGRSPSHYGRSFKGTAHGLLGGDVTSDIYQWSEKQSASIEKRRLSDSSVQTQRREQHIDSPEITASDLRTPGMFRRHFVRQSAIQQGKPAPVPLTRNFIDFLIMYGQFGGDVHPSDDEQSDNDDQNDLETQSLLNRPPNVKIEGTSKKKAFFMILKAFVGTGVLFLPKAFSQGGMGFSIILMVILGYLTLHCMLLLVETSRKIGGSFGEIGEITYGPRMKSLVLTSIASAQMGFSCAYYIFVAQNLKDLIQIITECRVILPDWFCIVIQFLLYIPLSWIRKIKNFSFTALIADVFILMGLGYIFYYDLVTLSSEGYQPIIWFNFESFPLFIGTALFAFEGICLILPISDSMAEPNSFGNVLTLCLTFIGLLFITIGATGYLTFGDSVATVVFLNLPKGSLLVWSLQVFYVIAIMLSFPLCVYPAIRITEEVLFGINETGKKSLAIKWQKNVYRAILVIFLAAVAFLGSNNLDKFVSLVGCFACIPLSFIYPAMFHYKISTNWRVKMTDIAIAVFGIVAMIYTTGVTIDQFVVGKPDIPLDRCK